MQGSIRICTRLFCFLGKPGTCIPFQNIANFVFFYIKRDLQKKIKKHKTAKFILNCKNKIKVQLCALLRSVPQLVAQLTSWQCQNWFPLINDIPHTHTPFFPPKNKKNKKKLMKTAHRFASNGTDKTTKMTTK